MFSVSFKRWFSALAIALAVVWFVFYGARSTNIFATRKFITRTHRPMNTTTKRGLRGELRTQQISTPTPKSVNLVLPATFNYSNEEMICKTVSAVNMTFPICYYDRKRGDCVSKELMMGSYYETESVASFLRLLRRDRHLQLVDIGANLGVYSLPAARLTSVLSSPPGAQCLVLLNP